jgi:KaiC/GvpD/RAD55 family RecA-like ATPase
VEDPVTEHVPVESTANITYTVSEPGRAPQPASSPFGEIAKVMVPALEGQSVGLVLPGQATTYRFAFQLGEQTYVSGLVIDFEGEATPEAVEGRLGHNHLSYLHGGKRRAVVPLAEALPMGLATTLQATLTGQGLPCSFEPVTSPAGGPEQVQPNLSADGACWDARQWLAEQARAELEKAAPQVSSYSGRSFERLLRRADGHEVPFAVPWLSLAQRLGGGMWPGLYVLAGGTGDGKTQLVLQLALHGAAHGFPVLYIALELGETDLTARFAGLLTDQMWSHLYIGADRDALLRARAAVEEQLSKLPLHTEFGDSYGWDYSKIRVRCEQMVAAYRHVLHDAHGNPRGPFLVVLDFLQIVSGPDRPGREEALRERIQRAAYAGRAVARDLDAAVLLVSSASRGNYDKMGSGRKKWRQVRDGERELVEIPPITFIDVGKESGEIEYGADGAMALVTEKALDVPQTRCPPGMTPVHVALAKGRAVLPGWVTLGFDGCRFHDLDASAQSQTAEAPAAPPPPLGGGDRAPTAPPAPLGAGAKGQAGALPPHGASDDPNDLSVP